MLWGIIVHPGEILSEELKAEGISAAALARDIDVPANRINQIISGKRAITGDMALRLGHWFGTGPELWMNLQSNHDLAVAARDVGPTVARLPRRAPEAA